MVFILLALAVPSGFMLAPIGGRLASAWSHKHHTMSEEYDLSKPTFDLLELRSFRRDTILIYDSTSRTEQLRILFFGSSALVSAGYPYILSQLLPSFPPVDAAGLVGSAASALLFAFMTVREKSNRGRNLLRLERELSLGELSINQPANSLGGGQRSVKLESLREKRRVVIFSGSPVVMLAALQQARVYRRRLVQSGIVLVGIDWPTDGTVSGGTDAPMKSWEAERQAAESEGWLWRPTDQSRWRTFYADLLGERVRAAGAGGDGVWFALSLKGRSCASGLGTPVWDELLGTKLPPLASLWKGKEDQVLSTALDPALLNRQAELSTALESSAAALGEAERSVLAAQARLYDALRAADHAAVAALFVLAEDAEVSVLAANGRLDGWEVVLKYEATVGMQIASRDATLSQGGLEAFSTAIEFPRDGFGTLLCTQRWMRSDTSSAWRLAQHRTIPYAPDVDAPACLRCDRRGCVALLREGGPKGPAGMPGDGKA